ncbi:MAG: hypothetical protein NZ959_06220 [Armatimonadetes bacterium]|nr:hypothetical protein [Armatimonadota bacterium]MDW8121639.1 hypothetical protein [Armatimonadota bacterium]
MALLLARLVLIITVVFVVLFVLALCRELFWSLKDRWKQEASLSWKVSAIVLIATLIFIMAVSLYLLIIRPF